MTGFRAFNEAGIEIFNSGDKVLRAESYASATIQTSDYLQHVAITQDQNSGFDWACGYMDHGALEGVQWFRPPVGKCILPLPGFIYGSGGVAYQRLTGTPGQAAGAKGFLNVYSPTGELTFSAAALASTPVVRSVIQIPQSIGSSLLTFDTGFPSGSLPWLCASSSPGKYSADGVVTDMWGYVFKFINGGTQVQVQAIRSPGSSIPFTGFSVPLAYIPNYP